jgi:hypothetical protein
MSTIKKRELRGPVSAPPAAAAQPTAHQQSRQAPRPEAAASHARNIARMAELLLEMAASVRAGEWDNELAGSPSMAAALVEAVSGYVASFRATAEGQLAAETSGAPLRALLTGKPEPEDEDEE